MKRKLAQNDEVFRTALTAWGDMGGTKTGQSLRPEFWPKFWAEIFGIFGNPWAGYPARLDPDPTRGSGGGFNPLRGRPPPARLFLTAVGGNRFMSFAI